MKATIAGAALIALAVIALAGTGAYFVLRHMENRTAAEADAVKTIDAIKARFGTRPPLVEIADPIRADIRINRSSDTNPAPVQTIHVVNWKRDTGELIRTEVPLWLMRFSSLNIGSELGIVPANFRLTVSDIQRYGPGIVVDYGSTGTFRVLVWVD